MEIVGKIVHVNFYNSDNGYGVVLLHVAKESVGHIANEAMSKQRIVVVGCFDHHPSKDESYIFFGEFVRNPNYGLQFKFDSFERPKLDSAGVIQYLSSDLFPGVGPATATRIVSFLGPKLRDQRMRGVHLEDALFVRHLLLHRAHHAHH